MREKEIEKHLCKAVERIGGVAYKFTSPMNRGVADRVVCLPNGTVWFIELKAPDGRLTELQKRFGQRMADLKQNYTVLYTKEDVDEWQRTITSLILTQRNGCET